MLFLIFQHLYIYICLDWYQRTIRLLNYRAVFIQQFSEASIAVSLICCCCSANLIHLLFSFCQAAAAAQAGASVIQIFVGRLRVNAIAEIMSISSESFCL